MLLESSIFIFALLEDCECCDYGATYNNKGGDALDLLKVGIDVNVGELCGQHSTNLDINIVML